MLQIIQISGVLFLLYQMKKFWILGPLWISILFITNFFGLLSRSDLFIGSINLTNQIIIGLLFLQAIIIQIEQKKIKNFIPIYPILVKVIVVFFIVQSTSLFNTFLNGYNVLESFLFPYLDFISFIFIPIIYSVFRRVDSNLVNTLWKVIIKFIILNCFIYIVNSLGILNFYEDSFVLVKGYENVNRTLEGFPIFIFFFFIYNYLSIRKKMTLKNSAVIFLIFIAIILSLTRSLLFAYLIIIILTEISLYKFQHSGKLAKQISLAVIAVFFLVLLVPDYYNAFENRISKITDAYSITDVDNLSSRSMAFWERFDKTNEIGPFLGIGFVYANDAHKLNLMNNSRTLIHPDIFWPNLYSTTGIIGSFFFLMMILIIITLFRKKIKTHKNSFIFLLYIFYTLILTFFFFFILFKGSTLFAITISFGLLFLNEDYLRIRKNRNASENNLISKATIDSIQK